MNINIDVSGLKKAQDLVDASLDLTHFSNEMKRIGSFLVGFFSVDVFDTEGAVFGRTWDKLQEDYRLKKAREYPGRGILERTGTMRSRSSFEFRTTDMEVALRNTTDYFDFHQEGRGVPQREIMRIDEERKRVIVDFIEDGINRQIKMA